jgi:hypothetical protein
MKYLIFLPITLLSFGVAFGDYQPGGSGDLLHATDGGGGSGTVMPVLGGTGGPSDDSGKGGDPLGTIQLDGV